MKQKTAIINHLLKGGGITQLEALQKFGCMRLAARIHDLRRDGYTILSRTEKKPVKYSAVSGVDKTWTRYFLA